MNKLKNKLKLQSSSRTKALIFAAVFATIGSILLFTTRAAGPFASLEPEQGSKTAEATTNIDSQASGGQYVQFGSTNPTGDCLQRSLPAGIGMEWPNECNTGVIGAGLTYDQLTPSGSITTTSDGQVIEDLDIRGRILIKHNNVVIRNSRITCGSCLYTVDTRGGTNTTISYVEIDGEGLHYDGIALYGGNYIANNLNLHGSSSPINVLNNVVIENSYLHDFAATVGTHSAGVAISTPSGNSNITLRHNNIHQNMTNGASAAISIYNNGVSTNLLIENNLLNTTANYCMFAGALSSKDGPHVTYTRWIGNHFDRAISPNCGTSGPYAARDLSAEGNEWSGNVWHDTGQIVP